MKLQNLRQLFDNLFQTSRKFWKKFSLNQSHYPNTFDRQNSIEMANLSPLVFYPRFAHVTEQIFEQLDQNSLSNCKEVSKSWKEIIDHKNLPWIQIVNVPKIVQNGETYLHHAAKTGQSEMFVKILEGETVKNPKNNSDQTPFHYAFFMVI